MARVIWSPQALADLEAIGDHLAREAPAYAQALVDGAFAVVERLGAFPHSGRAVPEIEDEDPREVIYKGYRIFYVVGGSAEAGSAEAGGGPSVHVLSVFHSARQFGGGEGLEPR